MVELVHRVLLARGKSARLFFALDGQMESEVALIVPLRERLQQIDATATLAEVSFDETQLGFADCQLGSKYNNDGIVGCRDGRLWGRAKPAGSFFLLGCAVGAGPGE